VKSIIIIFLDKLIKIKYLIILKMEGTVAYYEVQHLYKKIETLEKENAELKKKLEATTAERLGFRHVSFGSPCMSDPEPAPESVKRSGVWNPYPNANWREDGIY
jgi:hypothetical protein